MRALAADPQTRGEMAPSVDLRKQLVRREMSLWSLPPSRAVLSTRSATSAQGAAAIVVFSRLYRRCFSLDHLVGTGEQRLRYGKAERFRCVEIDDQLEFGGSLDRQVGWLGPVKDLAHVNSELATVTDLVRPIADQAALRSEFTPLVDRRNAMARCKRYELLASAVEECIAADDKRASMQLNEGGKCGFKIVVIAGF